jgi:ABC-2 type transport system permease protein
MASGTSYFNSTLYRKAMVRFWPLWALYGLIWMFAIPFSLFNAHTKDLLLGGQERLMDLAQNIPGYLQMGVWIAALFGVLCAMAVFGYLYSSRSACMMHALPVRREALFLSHYLAGLSFLLLPQLVVALIALAMELSLVDPAQWGIVLPQLALWLLCQSGIALFFFSFAAFCAMFTGHILALPAFYGVLNGLVFVLALLIHSLLSNFCYGYSASFSAMHLGRWVEYCTPILALSDACSYTTQYNWIVDGMALDAPVVTSSGLASPATVAAYAGVGVVFALLALWVYRCRQVESAGDVVSIPLVRPIFRCGVAFCAGLCFGMATAIFFSWSDKPLPLSLCVVLWAVVGYFLAEMLLQKSFRVLRAWKGALAMAAVMVVLCLSCFLDLFGIATRVPTLDSVSSLTVTNLTSYPVDSGRNDWTDLTDPDQIQAFLALHQAVVDQREQADAPGDGTLSFSLTYTLNSGATLSRSYYAVPVFQDEVDQVGSVTWAAEQILQDRALVAEAYGFDRVAADRITDAELDNVYNLNTDDNYDSLPLDMLSGAELADLWQAVCQDFDEGTIGVRYLFNDQERLENTYVTDLSITWIAGDTSQNRVPYRSLSITLTPNASHTLAWLDAHDILGDGYALLLHDSGGSEGASA